MRAGVDLVAAVIDAVADHRPAVISAGFSDVDLVAAARTVLVHPQFAGLRVESRALRIAMAVAPDFRLGARPFDEGIVYRRRAVWPNAHDLAEVVAEILRLIALGELFA